MKKIIKSVATLLMAAFMLMSSVPVINEASAAPRSINVYNWGVYISDGSDGYIDVNKAFTEATGIVVNYTTYESNESMYTKLKTGGSSYDVVIPSDYMIARLIDEDMLEPINFDNIPNYKYIDEEFKNTDYDPTNEYSVPYTWGTVGLIYNSKYVTGEVTSWDPLWDEAYAGKILMFDNPRDAFAISQCRLGIDVNTEDEGDLNAAAEELKKQRPLVQTYVMDQVFAAMEREEAWLAPYYAGDYLLMAEENENLKFCFPEEGFNVFIDAMCIPKGCSDKEAAEAYINFLCNPEISGQNLDYLGYSTPISEAKQYMDPETAASDIAYPDSETLERASSFVYLSAETNQLMDELWLDAKTDGNNSKSYIIIAVVIVVIIVAALIFLTMRKRKRKSHRGSYKK